MAERRRGPYKRYLNDPNAPIPLTTRWRREKEARIAAENDQVDRRPPIDQEQNEDQQDRPHIGNNSSDDDEDINMDVNSEGGSHASSETDESSASSSDSEDTGSSEGHNSDIPSDSDDGTSSRASSIGSDEMNRRRADFWGDMYRNDIENDGIPDEDELLPNQPEEIRRDSLYPGAQITVQESELLIMSFLIRWGLEDKSIEHLLKLIDCHLPAPIMLSKYLFLKKFPTLPTMKSRYMCSDCDRLLPEEFEIFNCHCGKRSELNAVKEGGDVLVQLSITEQLRKILNKVEVVSQLRKECTEKDVISGEKYKNLRARGIIGDHDLTLQWNTDGVSPFKSSKISMWPIQACVNELPYSVRRDNMILCGLYYGKKKPPINSFLRPFVQELTDLHTYGAEFLLAGQAEPIHIKVHTLLASVDSVARPVLQGIHQFNGKYGCSFCLKRGKQIARKKGTSRVYKGIAGQQRTLQQHVDALDRLIKYNADHRKKKTHIEGVKTTSILLTLPYFNVVSSFTPDYLHCICEGVVKSFLFHWCDSRYEDKDWYLDNRSRRLLSDKLKRIKPPFEVTRAPRGLDDLKLWKASELRAFLVYYSLACLKYVLPPRHLRHFFLFVYGMYVFLKEDFNPQEFFQAKAALIKFVETISSLYPQCDHLYKFNTHLILHIPKAVKNYGALWASSTFPYEHFNGVLTRLMTGTRSVPHVICRNFLRLRHISDVSPPIFDHHDCSPAVKSLYNSMSITMRSSRCSYLHAEGLRLFGVPENCELSLVQKVSIEQKIGSVVKSKASSYKRMIYNGTTFHASAFSSLKVRENSTVKLHNGNFFCIQYILMVEEMNSNLEYCVLSGEYLLELEELLCADRELNISSAEFSPICRRSGRIVAQLPQEIMTKCVTVPYGNDVCIIPLINRFERD